MSWYALRVKSKHEKQVDLILQMKSISSFTPLFYACHQWADRKKVVHLPLFPGYVFCAFDSSQRNLVMQTPGVIDVVTFGRVPAPIDDSEIQALQTLVASGCKAEPLSSLVVGRRAIIIAGPLVGLSGVILQCKSGCRLVLSVTLLQRSVQVEVDRADVIESPVLPMEEASGSCAERQNCSRLALSA
jgi:transcription antitermination factor NusG